MESNELDINEINESFWHTCSEDPSMHIGKLILLSLVIAITSTSLQASPQVSTGTPFLEDQAHPWKRLVLSYPSEESDDAKFELALECNPFQKSVFFDYLALRLISRSAENPGGFSGPAINSDFQRAEDWITWEGIIPLNISTNKGSREASGLYRLQPVKVDGSMKRVDTHFIKLNPGPMRSREAVIAKGARTEIASWITGEVTAFGGEGADSGMSFNLKKMSGMPFTVSFKFENLVNDISGELKNLCN